LDGVLAVHVTQVDDGGLELLARCVLMSDQTLVPALVTLNPDASGEVSVTGFVGEPGDEAGGMQRTKYGSREADRQYMALLRARPDRWVYQF
jgi:hypothetical protein